MLRPAFDIAEVRRVLQRAGDFGLHGHVAGRLAGLLAVGAVVVGVPESGDPAETPRSALQRPGQRRGPASVEHR